jgi:hypothetical protein
MTEKRGFRSVGALVMARAQKRLAAHTGNEELAIHAIKLNLSELTELET